jgi:TetR/AcrR family transcriptional regulator, transcriptional repressor for nem operon
MGRKADPDVQPKLMAAATDLIRRFGYVATTVDQICAEAGVTKGAFFHYFTSKEELAVACLGQWDERMQEVEATAPFAGRPDPRERVAGYMDFYIGLFSNPRVLKSCLAGTTLQEVAESHPDLRAAANQCLVSSQARFVALLREAARVGKKRVRAEDLAQLWLAAMQGSLVLYKGSADDELIPRNLRLVKDLILSRLNPTEEGS